MQSERAVGPRKLVPGACRGNFPTLGNWLPRAGRRHPLQFYQLERKTRKGHCLISETEAGHRQDDLPIGSGAVKKEGAKTFLNVLKNKLSRRFLNL